MPVVLLCSSTPPADELGRTMLWRHDVERHLAGQTEEALSMARALRPHLIAIDRRFPRPVELAAALRRDPATRGSSIIVLARGDFEPTEIELLEAGVNAILRFPPGPEWDERLRQLLSVPIRRDARFAVQFAVEAVHGADSTDGQALNLSAHGLLLQSACTLAVGDVLRLSFRIPGAFVDGRGTVVRLAGSGQYGVRFDALENDGLLQIERYIRTLG